MLAYRKVCLFKRVVGPDAIALAFCMPHSYYHNVFRITGFKIKIKCAPRRALNFYGSFGDRATEQMEQSPKVLRIRRLWFS